MLSKKKIALLIISLIFLVILFVPFRIDYLNDGGTKITVALAYKIIECHRIGCTETHDGPDIYFFPNNFISTNNHLNNEKIENKFFANVIEINENSVMVKPLEGEEELNSSDKITFNTQLLYPMDINIGDTLEITYAGSIMETYPAQINAIDWDIARNLQHLEYTDEWINKSTAEKSDEEWFSNDLQITRIYKNCFFAVPAALLPGEYKINGTLSSKWCVGDRIKCTYENIYIDNENVRTEADLLSVEESSWNPDPYISYKPVIYLYPEEKTDVSIKLNLNGKLTCTYPKYNTKWNVTALPDGTLKDKNNKEYNYLYWEGETNAKYDMSKGFCVKGEYTADFLENALEKLGLNRKEANEFIVYWLPLMENNPYNIISFQTDAYTEAAQLNINPAPDTLIRVFMAWQSSNSFVEIPEQKLTALERNGFTVIEWGGTEIK